MIKRITGVLLFIAVISVQTGYGQRIMGAAIVGLNATQVDGDEVYGYKNFGLNTGLSAIVPFNNKWSVSIENIYSEKGAHQRVKYLDSLDGSYDLKLNYLEVPVLLHFTDKDIVTFGAGMSWGRLVKVWEQRNGYEMPATTLESGIYRSSDLNFLLDVRFRVFERLRFNARYAYSIRPIATREIIDSKTGRPNIRDQYNGLFSFRLIYVFNERLSRESRRQGPQPQF
ncbi:outer membrane protein beta-barrel domain [Lentimicrobium saccharophilum]|uniref:Outer membrane protein beta-barrel domain n=1 Tax=Lentimicrobium saccharophilum TaxID=1678841 RepID=A0A0S7BY05_9BACT|nr:outer membrane beta-barrel protein [Lentimicrobium saccharophilum]GAP43074.1 outer membrane protein beta-barrel domain [Lentimicrobium saccharophilum]